MRMILDRGFSTVRCLVCGKVLVSHHVHDCRVCGCPQETMVDGGPAYLRYGGADMSLVEILVDPDWPRTLRLELLQEAARLAARLDCRFDAPLDATDGAVAAVVVRLRGCVARAAGLSQALRQDSNLWPPVLPGEPPVDMVRPIPAGHRGDRMTRERRARRQRRIASDATVSDDEKHELADRVAAIEGEPTTIRILGVVRLLWSGWEFDDRVSCVESVRSGARYLLILSPGSDVPEPADVRWLLDRRKEWLATVEDLDRFIAAFRGRPAQPPPKAADSSR
jgi:hypothetical protein